LGGLEIFLAVDDELWVDFSLIWKPIKIHPKSENVPEMQASNLKPRNLHYFLLF
jgi:hypothetical protein